MKIKRKIITTIGIMLLFVAIFPTTGLANAAPIDVEHASHNEWQAPTFFVTTKENTQLQIKDEQLVFDLRENIYCAQVTAKYTMYNPTDHKITEEVVFPYVGPEDTHYSAEYSNLDREFLIDNNFQYKDEVCVSINGERVQYKEYVNDYEMDEEKLLMFRNGKEIIYLESLEPWMQEYQAKSMTIDDYYIDTMILKLICYKIEIDAGQTCEMEVNYRGLATLDRTRTSKYENIFTYLLTPAKNWASFGTLDITIIPNEKQPYLVNSTVRFEKENEKYIAHLDSLPSKDLTFKMYHLEKEDGMVWGEYEYNLAKRTWTFIGIGVVIIGIIAVFVIRKIRKKRI